MATLAIHRRGHHGHILVRTRSRKRHSSVKCLNIGRPIHGQRVDEQSEKTWWPIVAADEVFSAGCNERKKWRPVDSNKTYAPLTPKERTAIFISYSTRYYRPHFFCLPFLLTFFFSFFINILIFIFKNFIKQCPVLRYTILRSRSK